MPDITFRENDTTQAVGPDTPLPVRFRADMDQEGLDFVSLTLSAVANTVTRVEIPDSANGLRIRSAADLQFALNEDPEVPVVVNAVDVLLADAQPGGLAFAGESEVRQLPSEINRIIHLRSATASAAVTIEFF